MPELGLSYAAGELPMMYRATPFDFPLPTYMSLLDVINFVSSLSRNLCFVLSVFHLFLFPFLQVLLPPTSPVFLFSCLFLTIFFFFPSPKLVEADGRPPKPGSAGGFQLLKGSSFFAHCN